MNSVTTILAHAVLLLLADRLSTRCDERTIKLKSTGSRRSGTGCYGGWVGFGPIATREVPFPPCAALRLGVAGSPLVAQKGAHNIMSFADLGISKPVVRALAQRGDRPTLPRPADGHPRRARRPRPSRPVADRVGQDARLRRAAGRPASSPAPKHLSALVLAPTRELASQIVDELELGRRGAAAAHRRRLRRRRLRPADRRRASAPTSSSPPPAGSRT